MARRIVAAGIVLAAVCAQAHADKLVDPSKVAPEYREAAEKRRAEQIRMNECANKASTEKVLPRDRLKFITDCVDAR